MPIDTLKAARRLEELGFEEQQAEGLAELLSDLDVASATKEDLDDLEERLKGRIDNLEARVDERFDEQEARFQERMDRLEERMDEQENRFEERMDEQEVRFEERMDEQENRFEQRFGSLESRLETGLEREREGRVQLEKNLTERINGVEKETKKQIAEAKNTLLIAIISCAVLITGILSLVLSYTA